MPILPVQDASRKFAASVRDQHAAATLRQRAARELTPRASVLGRPVELPYGSGRDGPVDAAFAVADRNFTHALDRIGQAAGWAAVRDALFAAARLFGMDQVAGMPLREEHPGDMQLRFTNWPTAWINCHADNGGVENDPARLWALKSGLAIGWAALRDQFAGSDQGRCLYRGAEAAGWSEWLIVPVRTSRGRLGVVTIGGRRPPLRPAERGALLLAATTAYDRGDACTSRTSATLSPREMDCVMQLAAGAQFAEIATTLGVSVTTVRFHLDNARRKTGARSCTHLVALTLSPESCA